ncbi:MAG: streptomycin biosynthesis protein StrI [Opitutae bacterium]|nr:streptomycin biosynthesis protein StrI [Opitutae bacterium]
MKPQNKILQSSLSRRNFISNSGKIATGGALVGMALPVVHGKSSDVTQVALVGCGGRGTGAASNALSVSASNGPTKLVAMADVFQEKLDRSYNGLANKHKEKVDVPKERQFIGFDSYQKAMDVLSPGDVVIFTSPCAFRWVHYQYAIKRGLNVFMEKPVTPDGFSSRKMLELNEEAKKINLKVGVGLMCRHSQARRELKSRIEDGELGEILNMRAYRMQGPIASCFTEKKPANEEELAFQIKNFHSFLWLSGGSFSDFFIHNIDECCWMKGMWPVKCQAQGGRHYRGSKIDQNFDNYTVEYTFADETKLYFHGRNMAGCHQEFSSHAHGTKGYALISGPGGHRSQARIHKGQGSDSDIAWMFGLKEGSRPTRETNPYQDEWERLMDAIKNDKPHNEVERGVQASVVTSMGRMAAHIGTEVTYDQMLNSDHVFGPGVENLTMASPSPLLANADGIYPIPQPGIKKKEY